MTALKLKYPWLRCDQTLATLDKLSKELPTFVNIVKLQEKQNSIHRKYIELNGLADTAIIDAICRKFKIDITTLGK